MRIIIIIIIIISIEWLARRRGNIKASGGCTTTCATGRSGAEAASCGLEGGVVIGSTAICGRR